MTLARSPIADLAAIVRDVNAAAQDCSHVGDLLSTIEQSAAFEYAIALSGSRDTGRFVAYDVRGRGGEASQSWSRWPLRRLFGAMQPRRISHPASACTALALPFDYGAERCIVLGALNSASHTAEYEPFFETLENLKIPRAATAEVIPDDIPVSPVDPRILGFGLCAELQSAIETVLGGRAWSMTVPPNFRALRTTLTATEPDLLFVDLDHLPDPFGSILRVHSMIPVETKLIGLGEPVRANLERQGLIDRLLEHDPSERELFAELKQFVRMVPEMRKTRLRHVISSAESAMLSSRTPLELSNAGARHAADVMRGWASVHLVAETGAVFAAEHPRTLEPVLRAIPKTFLSDAPLFQLRADARFYEETTDDYRVRGALAELGAVSAASIPLRHGERRLGALVSISRDMPADSYVFEALADVAKVVTRRFEDFAIAPVHATAFERNGVWECLHHGCLEISVYRSRTSATAWDYRPIRSDLGILSVGVDPDLSLVRRLSETHGEAAFGNVLEGSLESERCFIGLCNPVACTVTYAARGFPAPLLFDAPGPAATLSATGQMIHGKATILPPAGLLVWDWRLRRWLAREGAGVESITEVLEDLRPPGLAIVVSAASPLR